MASMSVGLFLASSTAIDPVTTRVATGRPDVLVVFGAVAALLLIALLMLKELLTAYASEAHVRGTLKAEAVENLSRASDVAVFPLAAVFVLAVVVKVMEVV